MYSGARIVSTILSLIAALFLAAAVGVWFFVTTPLQLGPILEPNKPEVVKAAADAEMQANLFRAGLSLSCLLVALLLLLFSDMVRAVVNTARDTSAILELLRSSGTSKQAVPLAQAKPPKLT